VQAQAEKMFVTQTHAEQQRGTTKKRAGEHSGRTRTVRTMEHERGEKRANPVKNGQWLGTRGTIQKRLIGHSSTHQPTGQDKGEQLVKKRNTK